MKKMMLMLSAVVIITSFGYTAHRNTPIAEMATDWVTGNLTGKVKSVSHIVSTFDSTTGKEKIDSNVFIANYDEMGYRTKSFSKTPSGKIIREFNYSHFGNGTIKETTSTINGKLRSKSFYEIDDTGKYTGYKTYDSSGKQQSFTKITSTNEYGMIASAETYGTDGKLKSSSQTRFIKTHVIGGNFKDSTGKVQYEITYKLNEKGDPIEEKDIEYTKDSTKTEIETINYESVDAKGNWTLRTTVDEKGKPSQIVRRTFVYYKD